MSDGEQGCGRGLGGDAVVTLEALAPREDFPLTADSVYLNSAGMGLVPMPVQDNTARLARDLGTRGTLAFFENYASILSAPRAVAATLFAAPVESVAIISSVSEVISQIAAWRRPAAYENIVTIDIDHPSVSYPWLRISEDTGAQVRFVKVADDPGSLSTERVAELVDDHTAAISVSHVQWTSGYRLDIRALAEVAHAHGALLVVDATHSAGVVPLNCPRSGVDVLATGSFKWLCGYSGTGACYVEPGLAERLRPVLLGSRTSIVDEGYRGAPVSGFQFPRGAERLEYGSSTQFLRVAFAEAIRYLQDVGIERILEHNQRLGERLSAGLDTLGARIVTPRARDHRAGIISAAFPGGDSKGLVTRLAEHRIHVLERMGMLRFAPHLFNNGVDIEIALQSLSEILRS